MSKIVLGDVMPVVHTESLGVDRTRSASASIKRLRGSRRIGRNMAALRAGGDYRADGSLRVDIRSGSFAVKRGTWKLTTCYRLVREASAWGAGTTKCVKRSVRVTRRTRRLTLPRLNRVLPASAGYITFRLRDRAHRPPGHPLLRPQQARPGAAARHPALRPDPNAPRSRDRRPAALAPRVLWLTLRWPHARPPRHRRRCRVLRPRRRRGRRGGTLDRHGGAGRRRRAGCPAARPVRPRRPDVGARGRRRAGRRRPLDCIRRTRVGVWSPRSGMSVPSPAARGRGGGLRAAGRGAGSGWQGSDMHKVELEVWPDNEPRDRPLRALRLRGGGARAASHYRRRDGSLRSVADHGAAARPPASVPPGPRARSARRTPAAHRVRAWRSRSAAPSSPSRRARPRSSWPKPRAPAVNAGETASSSRWTWGAAQGGRSPSSSSTPLSGSLEGLLVAARAAPRRRGGRATARPAASRG